MSIIHLSSIGNRKRHRNPLEKKYRLTKLLCISEERWAELEKLEVSRRRRYCKRSPAAIQPETLDAIEDISEEPLRAEMTSWYHGMFTGLKTANLTEEQLWGDLSREQNLKLRNLLNGEF